MTERFETRNAINKGVDHEAHSPLASSMVSIIERGKFDDHPEVITWWTSHMHDGLTINATSLRNNIVRATVPDNERTRNPLTDCITIQFPDSPIQPHFHEGLGDRQKRRALELVRLWQKTPGESQDEYSQKMYHRALGVVGVLTRDSQEFTQFHIKLSQAKTEKAIAATLSDISLHAMDYLEKHDPEKAIASDPQQENVIQEKAEKEKLTWDDRIEKAAQLVTTVVNNIDDSRIQEQFNKVAGKGFIGSINIEQKLPDKLIEQNKELTMSFINAFRKLRIENPDIDYKLLRSILAKLHDESIEISDNDNYLHKLESNQDFIKLLATHMEIVTREDTSPLTVEEQEIVKQAEKAKEQGITFVSINIDHTTAYHMEQKLKLDEFGKPLLDANGNQEMEMDLCPSHTDTADSTLSETVAQLTQIEQAIQMKAQTDLVFNQTDIQLEAPVLYPPFHIIKPQSAEGDDGGVQAEKVEQNDFRFRSPTMFRFSSGSSQVVSERSVTISSPSSQDHSISLVLPRPAFALSHEPSHTSPSSHVAEVLPQKTDKISPRDAVRRTVNQGKVIPLKRSNTPQTKTSVPRPSISISKRVASAQVNTRSVSAVTKAKNIEKETRSVDTGSTFSERHESKKNLPRTFLKTVSSGGVKRESIRSVLQTRSPQKASRVISVQTSRVENGRSVSRLETRTNVSIPDISTTKKEVQQVKPAEVITKNFSRLEFVDQSIQSEQVIVVPRVASSDVSVPISFDSSVVIQTELDTSVSIKRSSRSNAQTSPKPTKPKPSPRSFHNSDSMDKTVSKPVEAPAVVIGTTLTHAFEKVTERQEEQQMDQESKTVTSNFQTVGTHREGSESLSQDIQQDSTSNKTENVSMKKVHRSSQGVSNVTEVARITEIETPKGKVKIIEGGRSTTNATVDSQRATASQSEMEEVNESIEGTDVRNEISVASSQVQKKTIAIDKTKKVQTGVTSAKNTVALSLSVNNEYLDFSNPHSIRHAFLQSIKDQIAA